MDLKEELGKEIKKGREDLGWSLRELGEKTGISYSYLSKLERGTHLPKPDIIIKLSDALGNNIASLIIECKSFGHNTKSGESIEFDWEDLRNFLLASNISPKEVKELILESSDFNISDD